MTPYERLHAQADILAEVATWTERRDEPTGMYGWVNASSLRLRAVSLRIEADVMHNPNLQ